MAPIKNTVVLDHPITIDGVTHETLTFRRMKARDALIGEGETSQILAGYKIFAALAGVSVEVIEELDMIDLTAVTEVATALMGKSVEGAAPAVN